MKELWIAFKPSVDHDLDSDPWPEPLSKSATSEQGIIDVIKSDGEAGETYYYAKVMGAAKCATTRSVRKVKPNLSAMDAQPADAA